MRRERIYELLETAERHSRAGRLRRAVYCYRKVLSMAKKDESEWELAQVRLGLIHFERGEISKAIPHLSRARETSPSEHLYGLWLGEALRCAGQPLMASSVLIDACRSIRHRDTALLGLAQATADLGCRSTGRRIVGLVAHRTPNHKDLHRALKYCQDA